MSNAAILFHPNSFDTSVSKLMGRQAAGEGFLRGFLRHAEVDRFYLWNWLAQPQETLEALVRRIATAEKPIEWIGRREYGRLGEPGTLFVSAPGNASEAWNRRLVGATRYSICGLTHTTASAAAMDAIVELLLAPVEPWDSLICTSRAVRGAVETQLAMAFDYLGERLGRIEPPAVRLDTIPLGVNVADFRRSDEHRRAWRDRLAIPDDGVAVLFVGRFSAHAKMNPVPMAMALERAAGRSKRPIHWVLSGWAATPQLQDAFCGAADRHAPSITTHVLDGRLPEVRFPVWSAADIFFSLSDNIQETFGLTPVEAMAAGLPSVISDWDGYRDLVRHQVDGFRIPTLLARPGLGLDLAHAHANEFESYDHYVGYASQFAAVDIGAAAEALSALIENPDLRARMGASALERARTTFDWSVVVAQYQALWAELAAIRRAAPAKAPAGFNPRRPDPFALFAGYPTAAPGRLSRVAAAPGATAAAALALLRDPTVRYSAAQLPNASELATIFALLGNGERLVSEVVEQIPPVRRGIVERGLVWLAKFGLVAISPMPALSQE